MVISVTAAASARDKRMTLRELIEFVEACRCAEVHGNAWLLVETQGWGSRLRRIEAEPH
jgi:hypothetical protein